MSSVKRGCIVLLLTLASACGGSTTSTPTPTATPTATTFSLTGQVTDGTTSTGISGATVSIADGANVGKSATTDGSGNYSFTGLQPAEFTLNVSATNYVSQSKAVKLSSSQTLAFQLTRRAVTVTGAVTDGTSGGILPNILVQIADGANAGQSVRTDGNGTYSLSGVTPGTFTLSLSAVSYDTLKRQITVAADTRVDFVLERTPPPPPKPKHLLYVTLVEGEQLSGAYRGIVTGPNGFTCSGPVTSCAPATFEEGTTVQLLVTLTNPYGLGTPIRWAQGCDTTTAKTCTVVMSGDKRVTIAIGCEIACLGPGGETEQLTTVFDSVSWVVGSTGKIILDELASSSLLDRALPWSGKSFASLSSCAMGARVMHRPRSPVSSDLNGQLRHVDHVLAGC